MEKFFQENNVDYRKCTNYHYQIINDNIIFNFYPTTNKLYINGMVKGFSIKSNKHLLKIIKEKLEIKCERVKRKPMTRFKKYLWSRNKVCAICGKKINEYVNATVDHIIPISKGGSNRNDNLQITHKECNYIKKDKI